MALLCGLILLNGCTLFRKQPVTRPVPDVPQPVDHVAADSTQVEPEPPPPKPAPPPPSPPRPRPDRANQAAAPPDTVKPMVSVRMSPEEAAQLRALLTAESLRAARALELIRNKPLTKLQQDHMVSADRFLTEARTAGEASDLGRACTLAEKARIIAEELEKSLR